MAGNQQFCLRWNNHQSTLISVFDNLLESGTLVDCTLAAEGQYLKAHKVVLSACSPFFEGVFSQHYEKHPIIILKDVTFSELKAMLDYMYRGEVNISQEQLGTFLKAAESLQIKGLTESGGNGDLKREQRKIPPLFPQGLVVEQRAPLLPSVAGNRILNNSNNNNNNNNDSPPPPVYPPQPPSAAAAAGGGPCLSPKRRKRRSSDETLTGGWMSAGGGLPDGPAPVGGGGGLGMKKEEAMSDSGGEGPYDFEDDEEVDLSKPGTSAANSHPSGVWNADSQSEEAFTLPGGSQEQERWVVSRPLIQSLKSSGGSSSSIRGGGGGGGNVGSSNSGGGTTPGGSAGAGGGSGGGPGGPLRNIACPTCQKTYSSQHTLRRHIRLECGKEPQFHCPYCPRRTKQRYNLMLHIARAHKPEHHLQTSWAT